MSSSCSDKDYDNKNESSDEDIKKMNDEIERMKGILEIGRLNNKKNKRGGFIQITEESDKNRNTDTDREKEKYRKPSFQTKFQESESSSNAFIGEYLRSSTKDGGFKHYSNTSSKKNVFHMNLSKSMKTSEK